MVILSFVLEALLKNMFLIVLILCDSPSKISNYNLIPPISMATHNLVCHDPTPPIEPSHHSCSRPGNFSMAGNCGTIIDVSSLIEMNKYYLLLKSYVSHTAPKHSFLFKRDNCF